jgi:hypothetical protein
MIKNLKAYRWFFIGVSFIIIGLIAFNTVLFFNRLKEDERIKMEIWATAQEDISNIDISNSQNADIVTNETILKVLQSNTTTPMISYSPEEDTYDYRNIADSDIDTPEKRNQLIKQFEQEYKPIHIKFNGKILQTIYYGNSPLVNKIKYYPAVLVLIMVLFFLAIYLFFKTSKEAEQNKLWAGMAKETAHQIGTPLSSLVGWAEILKTENVNKEYISEIEKDIDRLKTITERFSKIGSIPEKTKKDIVETTLEAVSYLKSRSSKLVDFKIKTPNHPIYVALNPQLYGWTIENLVRNAIDAMKGKGTITITIEESDKYATILLTDTGKGIAKKDFHTIFKPGFTTKKRGWGLGLSLAKRIIEKYHEGKIRVLKSTLGTGTTMEISLKKIT